MSDWTVVPPGGSFSVSAAETPTGEPPENYAFVMNVRSLVGAASLTLAPGHELRRANDQEVAAIRGTIRQFASNSQFMIMPWEQNPDSKGQWQQLPEQDWRYFVIAFRGTNQIVQQLEEAFHPSAPGTEDRFYECAVRERRPTVARGVNAPRALISPITGC